MSEEIRTPEEMREACVQVCSDIYDKRIAASKAAAREGLYGNENDQAMMASGAYSCLHAIRAIPVAPREVPVVPTPPPAAAGDEELLAHWHDSIAPNAPSLSWRVTVEYGNRLAAALRQRGEELEEERMRGDLHANLNRSTAAALGKPQYGDRSSWHDIPQEITALREALTATTARAEEAEKDALVTLDGIASANVNEWLAEESIRKRERFLPEFFAWAQNRARETAAAIRARSAGGEG